MLFQKTPHLRADHSLSEVRHETDQSSVPFVRDLGERCATRGHEHLPDPILERTDGCIIHPQKRLPRSEYPEIEE